MKYLQWDFDEDGNGHLHYIFGEYEVRLSSALIYDIDYIYGFTFSTFKLCVIHDGEILASVHDDRDGDDKYEGYLVSYLIVFIAKILNVLWTTITANIGKVGRIASDTAVCVFHFMLSKAFKKTTEDHYTSCLIVFYLHSFTVTVMKSSRTRNFLSGTKMFLSK